MSTETASLVQQISNLRDVITRQNAQIAALQALSGSSHGHMPEAARAEADATILAWGPNFRATLAWELEHEADAQTAYEAWEQLVLKMATARHAPAPSSEDTPADTPAPRVWRSAAAVPRYLDTSTSLRADDGTTYSRPFASSEFWFQTRPDGSSGGRHLLADLPADAWPLSEVPAGGKA